jgi:hypothetical protein
MIARTARGFMLRPPVPPPEVATETFDRLTRSYGALVQTIPKGQSDEASAHRIWYSQ